MAVLTGAFLSLKRFHTKGNADGRDGSPIKNDYSFLINRNVFEALFENASNNLRCVQYESGWHMSALFSCLPQGD